MKIILALIVASLTTFSCSTSKKAIQQSVATTEKTPEAAPESERDGSSYEKAIVIKENRSRPGISAEYAWVKHNYPEGRVTMQRLNHVGKKSYDILTVEILNGDTKTVYFDITNFFGKY